jgi:hypothetical protein
MDLIISDLHLTDNPLEEYRWGVFDWLDELKKEYDIENIFLLGDITEKKDHHSSLLTNRIFDELIYLARDLQMLWILRGNHDGIDPTEPFFHFLNNEQNIVYYTEPTYASQDYLFLPHSKDPANEWKHIFKKYIKTTNIIFMHQTVQGAKANNGFSLAGLDGGLFEHFNGLVFSGDIHKPQQVGNVIYVGSPYPVYFGDDFVGGVILLHHDNKEGPGLGPWERITYPSIKRSMIELDYTKELVYDFKVNKGDQFKIRMLVNRSDSDQFDHWKKCLKGHVVEKGGIIVSIELKLVEEKSRLVKKRKFKNTDPLTVFNRFAKSEGLDDYYIEKGKEFI